MSSFSSLPGILALGLLALGCGSAPTDPAGGEVLIVEPHTVTLSTSGDSASLRAVRQNSRGAKSACTDARWRSDDEGVATVNGSGRVKARAVGIATILATCGSMEASATIQVSTGDSKIVAFKAFPEAEGWGANALSACRGGGIEVLRVTNLANDGPGSLRGAVEASRNDRLSIIVFRVGGYLDLGRDIELKDKSCLYFAGQTAPGDGITIRRSPGRAFYIKGDSHDIVFRHLRFRGGYAGNYRGHIGIQVGSGEDFVLDHLSLGWTTDKAIVITKSATNWSHPISRVTVQRSILAEVFADHPTGMQISGADNDGLTEWRNIRDISIHRNLFAHNSHRNPNVTTVGTEIINNVIYNWRQGAVQSTRGSQLDVIANYFEPGPMTDSRYLWEVTWNCENDEGFEPSLYVVRNLGPMNSDPAASNWAGDSRMTACYYKTGGEPGVELPERFRRNAPLTQPQWPVTVHSASRARDDVLADVGASAGLSCRGGWVRRSDAVDQRVVDSVAQGTGPSAPPKNESDAGGFPSLDGGSPCSDTDGDGMPDEFEQRYGLNPNIPGDAMLDADRDGYSNIEEFVNATRP